MKIEDISYMVDLFYNINDINNKHHTDISSALEEIFELFSSMIEEFNDVKTRLEKLEKEFNKSKEV